jgi:hypothetical protein
MRRTDVTSGHVEPPTGVYDHEESGASIMLPRFPENDQVLDYHLATVRTTLDGFGIVEPEIFDAKLQREGRDGRRRPGTRAGKSLFVGNGGISRMKPPVGATAAWLIEEIGHLESNLDVALQLIGQLAIQLGPILDGQTLGPMWRDLAEAEATNRPAELQGQIEALIAKGDEPAALRRLRDLTRLTWDEVYALRSRWANYASAEKQRWTRRLVYRRVLHAKPARSLP